jgi:hypothetical protein
MKAIEALMETLPLPSPSLAGQLGATLVTLAECEQVCLVCADSCLEEQQARDFRHCIRELFSCASVCRATAQMLSRPSDLVSPAIPATLHACVTACQSCADLCQERDSEPCRICRDTCLRCQESCNLLLGAINPTAVAVG